MSMPMGMMGMNPSMMGTMVGMPGSQQNGNSFQGQSQGMVPVMMPGPNGTMAMAMVPANSIPPGALQQAAQLQQSTGSTTSPTSTSNPAIGSQNSVSNSTPINPAIMTLNPYAMMAQGIKDGSAMSVGQVINPAMMGAISSPMGTPIGTPMGTLGTPLSSNQQQINQQMAMMMAQSNPTIYAQMMEQQKTALAKKDSVTPNSMQQTQSKSSQFSTLQKADSAKKG